MALISQTGQEVFSFKAPVIVFSFPEAELGNFVLMCELLAPLKSQMFFQKRTSYQHVMNGECALPKGRVWSHERETKEYTRKFLHKFRTCQTRLNN